MINQKHRESPLGKDIQIIVVSIWCKIYSFYSLCVFVAFLFISSLTLASPIGLLLLWTADVRSIFKSINVFIMIVISSSNEICKLKEEQFSNLIFYFES